MIDGEMDILVAGFRFAADAIVDRQTNSIECRYIQCAKAALLWSHLVGQLTLVTLNDNL